MGLKKKYLEQLIDFALKITHKSEDITKKYFKTKIKHKLKRNLSPVTEADLKCEEYITLKITKKYPTHNILAEENGIVDNESEFKWIIDPIDGTKNYMRQYPFWGTLLALEYQNEIVLGVISMPALKECIYAVKDMGCYCNGKKAKVSKTKTILQSYLIHGGLSYFLDEQFREGFFTLTSLCNYDRGFGDCHGHSLIIKGMAEIMADPHVAPWDVAAIKICIEEAGGAFTDLKGNNSIYNGNALVTNGRVHEEALKILNG